MILNRTRRMIAGGASFAAALVIALAFPATAQKAADPPRPQARVENQDYFVFPRTVPLPRKDAFFGLHFDLHPQKTDTELGADVSEDNIRELLSRVRPDYVQYDCKGHAGYAGYLTKVGWPSPGIIKDSLAVWRHVTRDFGVGLYIHYSGVWDAKAIEEHPDWACVNADGRRDPNATSVFGPYVDKLLIPQLEEAAAKYALDGVWVDGDCWAARLDYSPAALAAWRKESGAGEAPRDRKDPRWLAWKMFNRRAFETYVGHYVDAIHAAHPNLQITSNWMYSTMAPKSVETKLDFLSGDYSPSLSVDTARLEARYLASTGMPWDLMAWGFDRGRDLGWSLKPAEQLEQEASVVLMQGGGFQIYNTPTRPGFVVGPIIRQEEQVANFCRDRMTVSFKSATVPQAAVLLSSETYWDATDNVFSPSPGVYDDLQGALHALLNLHYSVDVLAGWQLLPRLKEFRLVVVPDAYIIPDEVRQALTDYVRQGGSLLLLGQRCARLFEPALGVTFDGDPAEVIAELRSASGTTSANGVWQRVKTVTAKPAGYRYPTRNTGGDHEIAATINPLGRGQVGAVFGPIGSMYFRSHHPWLREFIGTIAAALFPDPAVSVLGPAGLDVALRRTRDDRLCVHFLNTAGVPLPDRYNFTDFVPPVDNIRVQVAFPFKPGKVTWVPGGGRVDWSWNAGRLTAVIPRLHIHGVLVIE